ncbi:MAG TPA: aminodeoxychorismate synthase component I [Flavobacteriales bacterium]|nr:aminodeoxychorismate synthase component I [Flavobacteriales bacterium]
MAVRKLPNLQPVVDAHKHVALLWDERLTGRAWLAVGAAKSILVDVPQTGAWTLWDRFVADATAREAWTVGWLGYDLHSCLGMTQGESPDAPRNGTPGHPGGFPSLHWWEPEFLLEWGPGEMHPSVVRGGSLPWATDVLACLDAPSSEARDSAVLEDDWQPLSPGWDRDTYLDKFDAVQAALKRGDIYEMNLCMPWQGKAPGQASWSLFERLAAATKAPHSAYIQAGDHRVLCASPERFLEKRGQTLRSQPIKGTVRRGGTPEEDNALKHSLLESEKERAENVMIVDLVRNDLSRVAQPNSVEVDELFGLHTFSTVHQMISTVSCQLQSETTAEDVLRAVFPMGSMTGAPKLSAMDLIASLEGHGRGVYSGTIGYVDAQGDWDLNVVIRSLMHRADTGRVDATVGGALTLLAQGDDEYDECLLKVAALKSCLER